MPVDKGTLGRRPPTAARFGRGGAHGVPSPPKGGACVGHPTELWYSLKYNDTRDDSPSSVAMAICHKCPVQLECLMYGLEWEQFGIWGGTTEYARKSIRSKLKISVARTGYE